MVPRFQRQPTHEFNWVDLMLRVSVISAREIDSTHAARWARFQEADVTLASPFCRPEFAQAVAAVRDDAYVGILETDGEVGGYFPFQRSRLPAGIPIGGDRSNCQAVIADPNLDWEPQQIIRGCGLKVWDFHHLVASQPQWAPYYAKIGSAPYLNLSEGFDGYAARLERTGSKVIPRLREKRRRIEREVGQLRLEAQSGDPKVLRTLLEWKSQQLRETGNVDRFALRWNTALLERVHTCATPGFQGMLSALYAGDQIAAVAMCLRSYDVCYWWFPTYNRKLSKFSPGLLLLLKLAESSASLGLRVIDLGKGEALYKHRLATSTVELAQGSVVVPSVFGWMARLWKLSETTLGSSPIGPSARTMLRSIRKATNSARY